MLKKKEKRPALEINLNVIPLLESLGLGKLLDQAAEAAKKGQTDIIEKIAAKIQQGEMEVKVNAGGKKKKVPISFVVRLKKA
ncbi:MAG: hypothetical protein AB1476_03595 [Candidatus Hadarchaeota archaeon]